MAEAFLLCALVFVVLLAIGPPSRGGYRGKTGGQQDARHRTPPKNPASSSRGLHG